MKFDKALKIDCKIVIIKKSTKFRKMSPRPLYPNQPPPKRKGGRKEGREEEKKGGREGRRKERKKGRKKKRKVLKKRTFL